MSLDSDVIVDRRRIRRKLTFWRVAAAVVAIADYFFQYRQWHERQKMSLQEMKQEFKQSEGDPHIKGRIRQLRHARMKKRMMAAVPKASVIITNPTHYSVALSYDRGMSAPVCVAKGADNVDPWRIVTDSFGPARLFRNVGGTRFEEVPASVSGISVGDQKVMGMEYIILGQYGPLASPQARQAMNLLFPSDQFVSSVMKGTLDAPNSVLPVRSRSGRCSWSVFTRSPPSSNMPKTGIVFPVPPFM